jgi:hypothetical protein
MKNKSMDSSASLPKDGNANQGEGGIFTEEDALRKRQKRE